MQFEIYISCQKRNNKGLETKKLVLYSHTAQVEKLNIYKLSNKKPCLLVNGKKNEANKVKITINLLLKESFLYINISKL